MSIADMLFVFLDKEPKIDAYTLWQQFEESYCHISIRQLDDALTELKMAGKLHWSFNLKGLRYCPVCTDGHGRYHAFVRRQDKIAHLKDHARYAPSTLPKFTARMKAREQKHAEPLGRLFA